MKSKVKFMYSYWTSTVNFLDVTVKVEKDVTLSTTHFAKPTASCSASMLNLAILFTQWKHYQSHNLLEFAGLAL